MSDDGLKKLYDDRFFNFNSSPNKINVEPLMTAEEEEKIYKGMLEAGEKAKAVEIAMENNPELIRSIRYETLKWAALYPVEFSEWQKDNGLIPPEGLREAAEKVLESLPPKKEITEELPSTDDFAASIFGWGTKKKQ
jgi:hypothetical protein